MMKGGRHEADYHSQEPGNRKYKNKKKSSFEETVFTSTKGFCEPVPESMLAGVFMLQF